MIEFSVGDKVRLGNKSIGVRLEDFILIALMAVYVAATVACFLLGSVGVGVGMLVGGLIYAGYLAWS